MTHTENGSPPNGQAEMLLNHPLLIKIFDKIENFAIERAIHADQNDDDERRFAIGKAQAIRAVRRELAELAKPEAAPTDTRRA